MKRSLKLPATTLACSGTVLSLQDLLLGYGHPSTIHMLVSFAQAQQASAVFSFFIFNDATSNLSLIDQASSSRVYSSFEHVVLN